MPRLWKNLNFLFTAGNIIEYIMGTGPVKYLIPFTLNNQKRAKALLSFLFCLINQLIKAKQII